jgi:hypothetical protein
VDKGSFQNGSEMAFMDHSSNGKLGSGTIYIQISKFLLGRLLRERPAGIKNLEDRGCKVFKVGKTMDKDVRTAQLRGASYGGASDWEMFLHDGEECCYPFTAALWNEQKFHKFVRGHTKITHLTRDQYPWLYDRDGHSSMEVYFGPPKMVADYIKACCLSTPEEMRALRDAREALGRTTTALKSETAKLMAAEKNLQRSTSGLLSAESKIEDLENALRDRNSDLTGMIAARNRWRGAAHAFGTICALLGWWIANGR